MEELALQGTADAPSPEELLAFLWAVPEEVVDEIHEKALEAARA